MKAIKLAAVLFTAVVALAHTTYFGLEEIAPSELHQASVYTWSPTDEVLFTTTETNGSRLAIDLPAGQIFKLKIVTFDANQVPRNQQELLCRLNYGNVDCPFHSNYCYSACSAIRLATNYQSIWVSGAFQTVTNIEPYWQASTIQCKYHRNGGQ